MGAEGIVVALIVGGAAWSVGSRVYRAVRAARRRNDAECGGGCCSPH